MNSIWNKIILTAKTFQVLVFFTLFLWKIPVKAQFKLPVEVLGEQGEVVSRTIVLSDEQATSTHRLWLQVNNLGYENKASVKVNDGAWINLNHQTVDLHYQEKARGGMAHGGYSTIRFSFEISDLAAGENVVSFRFNMSDGISNGYRIVKLNLLDENGLKLLSADQFVEDDPASWKPPYPDDQSIEEGKDLWYNADLWSNYLEPNTTGFWYGAELKAFQPIKANCSDCHTQDGRDLELFAYSNESIIERAKFHNLNEEEGMKIATYIRSLSDKHENVNRHGRPWNPPYQPGENLIGKPIEYWAAGAGLDAVLEDDADMLEYMFPDGVNEESVSAYFDSDKMVDRTILPIAIQLPDWKHWLPIIHPMDAFSRNGYYDDLGVEFTPASAYPEYRAFLESRSPLSEANAVGLMTEIREFWRSFRFFLSEGADEGRGEHWRADDGNARTQGLIEDQLLELGATSLARLLAVKNFEVVQEFDLQDKSHWFVDPIDQPADRQWFGDMYQVFEIPPHFTGCVFGDCQQFVGQPTSTGQYESTAWYYLQSIVNGGNGMISHNSPVDYNYQQEFILRASRSSGLHETLRFYSALNTMYQTRTWSGAVTPNDGKGFRIRVQGPWQFLGKESDAGGSQFQGFSPGYWPSLLDGLSKGMTRWVLNAQMRQFLKEVNKPENNLNDWIRWESGLDASNNLDPLEKIAIRDVEGSLPAFNSNGPYYADHMYWTIREAIKLGVDCHLIDSLIDWSVAAWPNIVQYESRTTTETHLFDELRQTNTAGVQLKILTDENCMKSVEAVIHHGGPSPAITWYVNGNLVSETSTVLSSGDFSPGDEIRCLVDSNEECIMPAANTAENTIRIDPDLDLTMTATLNTIDISGRNEIHVNHGDILSLSVSAGSHPGEYLSPVLWLDAMDMGSSLDDGDEVTSWKDLSSNANHAEPRQTELRPVYDEDGFNGLPAVVFGSGTDADGLELFNSTEDQFMETYWTIMIVGETNIGDDWTNLIGNKNTPSGDGWFFRFSKDNRSQISGGNTSQSGQTFSTKQQFLATITKKNNTFSLSINGNSESIVEIPGGDAMTNPERISMGITGDANFGTSRFHKGPIAEVMVFDRALAIEEIDFLTGYLKSKWHLNALIYHAATPLELRMSTPTGTDIPLIASENYQIGLVSPNLYGEYQFFEGSCKKPFYTLSVQQNIELNNQLFTLDENSIRGTQVGVIEALPFVPSELNYQIVYGNEGNTFAINTSTGELTVDDSTLLDFEVNPHFNLMVEATDLNSSVSKSQIGVSLKNINEAPIVVNTIPDQETSIDAENLTIDLRNVFSDNEGDLLTYTAVSGIQDILNSTIVNNHFLSLTGINEGITTVRVTATDIEGLAVNLEFEVKVLEKVPLGSPIEVDQVTVYPNPGRRYFYVSIAPSNSVDRVIKVYNFSGQKVEFLLTPVDDKYLLDLLRNTPGLYLLKIISEESTIVKKILNE